MKKWMKVVLLLTAVISLSFVTGCSKNQSEVEKEYKSKEDIEKDIVDKKKVVVDGEELDEYTLSNGMKIQGAVEDSEDDSGNEEEADSVE